MSEIDIFPFDSIPNPKWNVIVNDLLCVSKELKQFRFPRSRKKRIRNKWSMRKCNFRMEDVYYMRRIGNTLYVSRKHMDAIRSFYIKPQILD